eukprot:CAMPEP_0180822314 /NCGR_PEP_ID=MMETSP1038_2-20121128/71299_1 /TAXON_ID=632150 /ORGANISM="Azadinium spinosum, Strain 3D9" /LENGTH=87 /DNA_ID=CAMNT_0022864557 /DNA_START=134 /DNA_END=397 /DNA_ORIENTATION=+
MQRELARIKLHEDVVTSAVGLEFQATVLTTARSKRHKGSDEVALRLQMSISATIGVPTYSGLLQTSLPGAARDDRRLVQEDRLAVEH